METIRTFEAFAGYGSQLMALRRLEKLHPDKIKVEPVGIAEIDKYAIQAYKAVHGDVMNYGDISKIDWEKVPDFDLFTYSSPCFTAGTLVMTWNGLKPIESITDKDEVLTHTNRFQCVVKPMLKHYSGTMYNLKAMCFDNLDCTPEHPFYVREKYRKGHKSIRTFKEPEWVLAKDLTKNHYVGVSINQVNQLPIWKGVVDNRFGHHNISNRLSELFTNNSFWYLMGRYVGDGWKKNVHNTSFGIIICCNDSTRDKETLTDAIKSCGFNYTIVKERTVNKIQITSKELYEFVKRYGSYAYGKRIDGETLNLPIEYLRSFVDGYLASDGCVVNNLYKITTVSKELAYGLGHCVAKVFKTPYKIYFTNRPTKHIIENRVVNQLPTYQICWKLEKSKQDKAFYENGYIWCPIREINTFEADCEVYNMEVSVDNSYTANGCIVHNCQDFSQAGKQKGGEEGSGTRSSLLWECQKAITIKRPKYCLLENVSALVSEKFMPLFFKWFRVLEELGYKSFWKVLNAKDYGVPQNRERVFLLSIREDVRFPYYFPKPMKLEKRLKDVLEDNVDEKYYLKDVMVDFFMRNSEEQKAKGNGFRFNPTHGEGVGKAVTTHAGGRMDDNFIKEE